MSVGRAPIVLGPTEPLPEVLGKICAASGQRVVVDVSAHPELRARPDLVRVLRQAAAEAGKDLVLIGFRPPTGGRVAPPRVGQRPVARKGWHGPPATPPRFVHAARSAVSPRQDPPRSPKTVLAFAVAAGGLLAVVTVFVLPRARVTVETAVEPLVADLTVTLLGAATEPSVSRGTFPGRHVVVEETVEGTFPVETVVQRGERARGEAWLVNRTAQPQGIKGGTRLRAASGVVVRIEKDVLLPGGGRAAAAVRADAGGSAGNLVPQRLTLPALPAAPHPGGARAPAAVRADAGGSAGNLVPQRLTLPALPAASQRVLYAELLKPLTGGTDREVREVATADIARAAEALRTQSETRLLEQLRKEFGGGEWFDRPELRRVAVRDAVSDVAVGAEAGEIRVRALVRGEALAGEAGALRRLFAEQAAGRAGAGRTVLRAPPLGDVRVVDVRWEEVRAELSLHVETTATTLLSADELRERLAGRTPDQAERYLRALPGVVAARVLLSPVWIRTIPTQRRNVSVTFLPVRENSDAPALP